MKTIKSIFEALFAIAVIVLLFLIMKGCSDSAEIEKEVTELEPFYLRGREYECKNTERQLKIDKLNGEIKKLRE